MQQINFTNIMLSKRIQIQQITRYKISFVQFTKKTKIINDAKSQNCNTLEGWAATEGTQEGGTIRDALNLVS